MIKQPALVLSGQSIGPAWRLLLPCFIFAFSSLSYEFLVAQILSVMHGQSLLFYGLTIGVYIFALGMGSLMPWEKSSGALLKARLFQLEMLLIVLGGLAPFWLYLIDLFCSTTLHASTWRFPCLLGLSYFLVFLIGFLSGMELPILLRFDELVYDHRYFLRLLALDYFASLFGALLFPLWLFQSIGLLGSALLFSLLNALALLLLMGTELASRQRWLLGCTFLILAILAWKLDDLHAILSAHITGA